MAEKRRQCRLQESDCADRFEDVHQEDGEDQDRDGADYHLDRLLSADDHQVQGGAFPAGGRSGDEMFLGVALLRHGPGKHIIRQGCCGQSPHQRSQKDCAHIEPHRHHGKDHISLGHGEYHRQGGGDAAPRSAVPFHDDQGGQRGGKTDQEQLQHGESAGAGDAEDPQYRLHDAGNLARMPRASTTFINAIMTTSTGNST